MWKRLQRFRRLDSAARRLFLRGVVLLPAISLSLRLRGFVATQANLQRLLPSSKDGVGRLTNGLVSNEVQRTARMVRAAANYGVGLPTCLEQSLALWWLLGMQGIVSSVRIGANKAAGQFHAHAWVECDGAALNDIDESHRHYAVFETSFPAQQLKSKQLDLR